MKFCTSQEDRKFANVNFAFLIFVLIFIACSKKTDSGKLTGDFYIKLISFPVFDIPDSTLTSLRNKNSISKQDQYFWKYVDFLKANELLKKPYVLVRQENGDVVTLFLDRKDYDRIDAMDSNLIDERMKIRIEADVRVIKYDSIHVYEALGAVKTTKMKGITYWEK